MLEKTTLNPGVALYALIVDDDPLARNALANVLAARSDIEDFDCAENAAQACEKLQKERYQILLLDIHLPQLSGLELVDCLQKENQPVPALIFVTAHHQHAIAAFEKHAVDYVLKPFSNERIHEALNIAIRRTANERAANLAVALSELKAVVPKPSRMAIKTEGRILFIDPAEVIAAVAQGNYVLLVQPSGSCLLRCSISTLSETLRPCGFIRIHRSVLINTAWVQEIQPYAAGEYLLRTKGGKEYTVSRTYKKNLRSVAQLWIGGDACFAEET